MHPVDCQCEVCEGFRKTWKQPEEPMATGELTELERAINEMDPQELREQLLEFKKRIQ